MRVVGLRVLAVVVLVREVRRRVLRGQPSSGPVVALGVFRREIAVDQNQLDPHGDEAVELLLRGLTADDHGALETLHDRHQGEPHGGVAGGVLDDLVADGETAVGQGLLDHVARDAVLDAAHGVHELDLGEDLAVEVVNRAMKADQGCPADGVGDAFENTEFVHVRRV